MATKILLPDVLFALRDTLFERDGKEQSIAQGWENDTPQMQQAWPLAQRLDQERGQYADLASAYLHEAIKEKGLPVMAFGGPQIQEPFSLPAAIPLAVDAEDLQGWLSSWLPGQYTALCVERAARTINNAQDIVPFRNVKHGGHDAWYKIHAPVLVKMALEHSATGNREAVINWIFTNVPQAKGISKASLQKHVTNKLINEVHEQLK